MTGELLGRFLDYIQQKHKISLKYSLYFTIFTIFQSLQYKEVNTKNSTLRRHANYLNVHNDTICIRNYVYSCIVA